MPNSPDSAPAHDTSEQVPLVNFRPMGEGDAAIMETLARDIFAEDPWTSTMIEQELRAPGRLYLLPQDGGSEKSAAEPVGYVGVRIGPDADIMTIGVTRAWRGRGIGRELLNRLMEGAWSAGAERIFLEVRSSNVAAQRLYENAGFDAMGRVPRYFHHPLEDAITMRALAANRDGRQI